MFTTPVTTKVCIAEHSSTLASFDRMAATPHHHIALARALPPRLLSFLTRYPPQTPIPLNASTSIAPPAPFPSPRNPFSRTKSPTTGKYMAPMYSLRRQADLVKLAHAHKIPDLLPPSIKDPAFRERRRAEEGLQTKGTGVGQKVKGKKWERTMKGRLEKRRKAMLGMPALVREWRQLGHGRRWKKWPK